MQFFLCQEMWSLTPGSSQPRVIPFIIRTPAMDDLIPTGRFFHNADS